MFLLFFLIWILLSGEVTVWVCLSGAVVSLALYAFGVKLLGYAPRYDCWPSGSWGRACAIWAISSRRC